MASDAVQRGPARAVRAGVVGTAAVALAATAHVAGGGSVPGPVALAVLAVPAAWVCVALARRRRGPLTIGATLLLLQVLLHQGFMALAGMACVPAGGLLGHAGHAAAGQGAGAATCAGPAGATTSTVVALPPGLMSVAHLVATLATALVLARAERIAATLGGLLALVSRRLRAALVPYVRPWVPAEDTAPRS